MLCEYCQRKDLIKLTKRNRDQHIKACKLKYESENTEKVEKSLLPNVKDSSSNKKMVKFIFKNNLYQSVLYRSNILF
jgi:hypothetical protein